jgi:ABC-2 type transport system ATP-binding protein
MTHNQTAQPDAAVHTSGAIRLHGLAKSYRGPQGLIRAVRGIDVSIAAGETAALLGSDGAGKSTTIDMLLASPSPTGGLCPCSAARRARPLTRASSARCCRRAG